MDDGARVRHEKERPWCADVEHCRLLARAIVYFPFIRVDIAPGALRKEARTSQVGARPGAR